MTQTKIAVFASGSGSNFQAIEEAIERGELNAEIELVVTDKPECICRERAKKLEFQFLHFQPKEYRIKSMHMKKKLLKRYMKKKWNGLFLLGICV